MPISRHAGFSSLDLQAKGLTDFAADGFAIGHGAFGLGLSGVVSRIADENTEGLEPFGGRSEGRQEWQPGDEKGEQGLKVVSLGEVDCGGCFFFPND
jgi:hypothetical protein